MLEDILFKQEHREQLIQLTLKKVIIDNRKQTIANAIYVYLENIFKEIEKLMYSNENLINQRDLLLPRLMSGKLEV